MRTVILRVMAVTVQTRWTSSNAFALLKKPELVLRRLQPPSPVQAVEAGGVRDRQRQGTGARTQGCHGVAISIAQSRPVAAPHAPVLPSPMNPARTVHFYGSADRSKIVEYCCLVRESSLDVGTIAYGQAMVSGCGFGFDRRLRW